MLNRRDLLAALRAAGGGPCRRGHPRAGAHAAPGERPAAVAAGDQPQQHQRHPGHLLHQLPGDAQPRHQDGAGGLLGAAHRADGLPDEPVRAAADRQQCRGHRRLRADRRQRRRRRQRLHGGRRADLRHRHRRPGRRRADRDPHRHIRRGGGGEGGRRRGLRRAAGRRDRPPRARSSAAAPRPAGSAATFNFVWGEYALAANLGIEPDRQPGRQQRRLHHQGRAGAALRRVEPAIDAAGAGWRLPHHRPGPPAADARQRLSPSACPPSARRRGCSAARWGWTTSPAPTPPAPPRAPLPAPWRRAPARPRWAPSRSAARRRRHPGSASSATASISASSAAAAPRPTPATRRRTAAGWSAGCSWRAATGCCRSPAPATRWGRGT